MTRPVFRFAPSPNGALHLGHAYSALLNARLAERLGGRLLLRIEDIDRERCTPELEAAILCDLEWLGVAWEQPVRRQSDRFADYEAKLERLRAMGLVYRAFMSRGEIRAHITERGAHGEPWPHDPDGAPLYPGLERSMPRRRLAALLEADAPFAWRLDMGAALALAGSGLSWTDLSGPELEERRVVAAHPEHWGDVIIARRDMPTSYHLSVVVDDAIQQVSHVVRGADLIRATDVHVLLQRLLGLPTPAYHHHRLILGPDGRKLSKSLGDKGIASLRAAGHSSEDVRRMVGL